jgi:hypothetical protein
MQKQIRTQTNLDSFFTNKSSNQSDSSLNNSSNVNNINSLKKYFYLSWNNEFRPDEQAYWLDKKPDKVNFIEEIQSNYIYKGYTFYLCGYFKDYDDPIYNLSKETKFKNIFFLKSHLQKSIRKQNDSLAIQTSYHLLKLDHVELLRRISIIMIEDVQIHESFTTIIWLMIALSNDKKSKSNNSSKFRIKKYIYEWVLGVIYTLCQINEINNFENKAYKKEDELKISKTNIQLFNSFNQYNREIYSILYSIHIRISFGGLNGDIEMLKNFANYINIINITKNINKIPIRLIKIYVKELEIDDIDYTAIDYHCNSNFLEYIHKKFPHIEMEELKKIIWYHSSGINYRISKSSNYNIEKWNEIKDYVEKSQKYLINSL